MRAVLIATAAGLVLSTHVVGCGSASPTEATKAAPPRLRPSPPPTPKNPALPVPEPAPTEKEPPTFEADWKAAGAIAASRRNGWEKRAEKAMRVLTADERDSAEFDLMEAGRAPWLMWDTTAAALNRRGLGEAVRAISSEWAFGEGEFRAVARAVWGTLAGPAAIADMAERWGQLPVGVRDDVRLAVTQNTSTTALDRQTRNALLSLGLREWLAR